VRRPHSRSTRTTQLKSKLSPEAACIPVLLACHRFQLGQPAALHAPAIGSRRKPLIRPQLARATFTEPRVDNVATSAFTPLSATKRAKDTLEDLSGHLPPFDTPSKGPGSKGLLAKHRRTVKILKSKVELAVKE
jgi:hypothetical protein